MQCVTQEEGIFIPVTRCMTPSTISVCRNASVVRATTPLTTDPPAKVSVKLTIASLSTAYVLHYSRHAICG